MKSWRNFIAGIVLGAIAAGITAFLITKSHRDHLYQRIAQQEELLSNQSARMDSLWAAGWSSSVNDMLAEIYAQLNNHRGINDTTITRLAALSASMRPYFYRSGDTLAEQPWSPGRGQLLLALAHMSIDTGTFARIKEQVSFAGADLHKANLAGKHLRNIDLAGANLQEANLRGAVLKEANLQKANLWGAQLQITDLTRANLRRANLQWANLDSAVLHRTNLNSARLGSASLRNCDMQEANLQWADAPDAFFNASDLSEINMWGSKLNRAHFVGTNFKNANLRRAEFNDADLTEAQFEGAWVFKDHWFEQLAQWQTAGTTHLKSQFELRDSVEGRWYQLVRASTSQ